MAEPSLAYFVVAIVIRSLEEDRISLCGPVWPWTDCRCVPHDSWFIRSSPKTAKESGDAVSGQSAFVACMKLGSIPRTTQMGCGGTYSWEPRT